MVTSVVHPTDAVVFIVTRTRNPTRRRVLWRLRIEYAKRVCRDPRTAGRSYMLVWTSHYVDDQEINRYVPDRLGHTAVLTELGVTILASHDTPLSHALAA